MEEGSVIMDRIKFLQPVPKVSEAAEIRAPKLRDLKGKVVAFLSNEPTWRCLPTLWATLDEQLVKKYGVAKTFKIVVPLTLPAPSELMDQVARESDAIIAALGA